MIKYKDILKKPSADIPWNKSVSDEINEYFREAYVMTGKMLCYRILLDDTTSTSIIIFNTQDDYNHFFSDVVLEDWKNSRNNYNNAHDFIHTSITTTEIDVSDIEYIESVGVFGIFRVDNITENIWDEFKPTT